MIVTTDGNIPSTKAHSINVMKMAQGFCKIGQNVELVTLLTWPLIKVLIKIRNIYNYYGINKKFKIKFLPIFNRDFLNKSIGAKNFNFKAANYIKKQKPKFVYCRSYMTAYFCVKHHLPTMVETHTTNYDHPDLQKIYSISRDPNFLGLVTINETIKDEHIKRGIPPEKILVLEDGVDMDQYNLNDDKKYWRNQLNLPLNKKIVMFCGSLHKEKGIEDILLCAKKLGIENIIFVLVGGNDEQISQWKNFNNLNNIKNVIFTGFVANNIAPGYLKSADVLLMPYNTTLDYKVMDINSTSPIKLFEYMAAERPIVSSAIPVIEKIVKNNESAYLAVPNDIDDLARLTLLATENTADSKRIANNAYDLVRKYDWKNRCQSILDYCLSKLD